jgi:hypothetical protein
MTSTILEMQVVILVGDLTYADNWRPDGTLRPPDAPPLPYQETFQPKWDAWGRFTEQLAAQVTLLWLHACNVRI